MKTWLIIIIVLVQSLSFSQEISFSRDSLYFFISEHNPTAADTLWLHNVGSNELEIDSIISASNYGYKLEFANSDTSFLYGIPSDFEDNITLLPSDSFRIVVRDPDRCPICKSPSIHETLTDKVIFVSNSKSNNIYNIFTFIDAAVSIQDELVYPSKIKLSQNYPNPFNPITYIDFYMPKPDHTSIEIFNSLGQSIGFLINNNISSGFHKFLFDGTELPSGTYYYNLKSGSTAITRKMTLIK